MKLLEVDTVAQAFGKLLSCRKETALQVENVHFMDAVGRVLAQDVYTPQAIPNFRRSTVDGYAVVAKDTAAAGESIPVFLSVKGQVEMGEKAEFSIQTGECAEVPTGGMLPDGADAVVMVEYSEEFGNSGVALYKGEPVGQHVVQIGEDMPEGGIILKKGSCINAQAVGAFAAAGITSILVYKPLALYILSTGDELIQPDAVPQMGQVRDINTYALKALAEKNGYQVVGTGVVQDDANILQEKVQQAMQQADVVLISGGSSQGKKDATCDCINAVSSPGVFTHGMAIKPGKPTILGYDENTNTILGGLPGHPVSAMMVFELLFSRLYHELAGMQQVPVIKAILSCNVASSPGKETCWPVALRKQEEEYIAEPIFGKSGLITTLTKADGYFTIGHNTEGLSAGKTVNVHLF